MKKHLFVAFSIVLLVCCNIISGHTKAEQSTLKSNVNKHYFSDSQNDLVYHDYGKVIKISSKSRLDFSLDSYLNNEILAIYAINLENNMIYKIDNIPDSEGFYNIVAMLNNGEYIDITPKVIIESESEVGEDNGNGVILLK